MIIRLHTIPASLVLGATLAFGCSPAAAEEAVLPAVTVSASALSLTSDEFGTPVRVLVGEALERRRAATLGETLAGEPGVAASHFGAGASRPIIRGMDGPRVKVLSDGSELMDASTLSPDHAVALEPLLAERIEVLRGPSALAYGGGAIGGVVNVLDRRVPTETPDNGVEGSVALQADSAARGVAAAFEVTAGRGPFVVHAEGLMRDARDYRVGHGWTHDKVPGSYNQTDTGSLGVSWVGERGYLGLAYTRQRNEYGLPGHSHAYADCHPHGNHLHCGGHGDEDDHDHEDHGDHGDHAGHDGHDHDATPYVKLDSERWDLRGELRDPFAGFSRARLRASWTDYGHDELEPHDDHAHVGTRFRSRAGDVRAELEHAPLGGWRGVVGVHASRRDFRAEGDEAYVPPTLTHRHAAFLIEEYTLGDWRLEAGLRSEWQDIDVDGPQRDRNHHGHSLSVGTVWHFAPRYSLGVTLSRTQRLPSAEELYANGLHAATSTWERGNANLKAETARNLDVTLRKLAGPTTFAVSLFHNRVADYIHARTLDVYEDFQLIEYAQRDAHFTGVEAHVRRQIDATYGVTLFGDYVRAKFAAGDGDRDLPRIPAQRLGVRADAEWGAWRAEAEAYRVGRQRHVAAFEHETAGYNMVNVGLSYSSHYRNTPWQVHVRLNNVGDARAYAHTSFIKQAAPLPGRNLSMTLRVLF